MRKDLCFVRYHFHIGIGIGTARMEVAEFGIGKPSFISSGNREFAGNQLCVAEAAAARTALRRYI